MASYCACCGRPLSFGQVVGNVKYFEEKLKLCEACSEALELVENAVAQGDKNAFWQQAERFQARLRSDTENTSFHRWWQDFKTRAEKKLQLKEQAEQEKWQRENLLLTTGPFFEGYHVRKYLGIVTGEANSFSGEIQVAGRQGQENMKEAAANLGANGILGISVSPFVKEMITDHDIRTGVLVMGTAVLLEPATEPKI